MKVEDIIERRIEKLKNSKPDLNAISNDRKKHPAWKQWKGRLNEARYILKLIKRKRWIGIE